VRVHRGGTVALVVVAVLGAGACGGADEPRLTKAQFIERGSAFCAESSQRIDERAQATFTEPGVQASADQVATFATDVVAPTIEREVERLSELRPPQGDEERIDQLLEAGRDGVDEVRQDPTVLLSSADDGFGRYRELATAYGLQNCGGASQTTRNAIEGINRQG
jgi:hypothetical protein